ncbi:MAG: class I SAM-dependent methyltransferase [Planctomycetes bacterium]|nr:class I SAM-dependent methyltransferase [Planctomycetota bacterium]
MKQENDYNPLALDVPHEVKRLREALNKAGYDTPHIAALLRFDVGDARLPAYRAGSKELAFAMHYAKGDAPLNTLVQLFLLGATVNLEAARVAFAPSTPEALLSMGLLEERDGGIATSFQITPLEHLLLLADPHWGELKPKHVVSAGAPSIALAQATIRRKSRSTLDVGAGCGIQAFFAAAHSDQVVGVDRNPRAVNVAAFNAQLNGFDHVEFLAGDLYAPVRDRRFDLIVANPPYVISPESRFIYRDSGLKGDEIAQRVIGDGAPLLEEGGYLQLTCEWAHLAGTDWRDRMAKWFGGTGCDACVLRFTTVAPDVQAEMWLRSDPEVKAEEVPERFRDWLAYHRAEGIEAVSDGIITLRKRSTGPNWIRFDDAPKRIGQCGPSMERAFAAVDFLTATHQDETFLEARLRLAPDVRWEQRLAPTPEGWDVRHSQLYISAGLAYRGDANRQGLSLAELCNGERTVRQVLESLADPNGPPLNIPGVLAVTRQLVEQGFLLPEKEGQI